MEKAVKKYNETCDYLVVVRLESPFDCIAQKHIMNCSYRTAKSYLKHFNKYNNRLWSDMDQSGVYCMICSRNYCTNHNSFENSYNQELINYII